MNKENKRTEAQAKRDTVIQVMSEIELAGLGDGEIAYIKVLTSDEAINLFPSVIDLPMDTRLYALHAADGTPIALTDSRDAALSHAIEDELQVAALH